MNSRRNYYLLVKIILLIILLVLTSCSTIEKITTDNIDTNTDNVSMETVQETAHEQLVFSEYRTEQIFNPENHNDKFAIWFFSLEHPTQKMGDSMLLRTPDGVTMLIDAGTPECGSQIVRYLEKLRIDKLDFATATHAHSDHVGGFYIILKNIPIDKMLLSGYSDNSISYMNFENSLKTSDTQTKVIKEGDSFQLGQHVTVEVLNPLEIDDAVEQDSSIPAVNNSSVVYKICYDNNTFLFTGDIYIEAEQRLVNKYGESLNADLLKVPHHGSANTSSCMEFVNKVFPCISIVTHNLMPSKSLFERYENIDSKVYVTLLDGNILVTSDGTNIKVITEKDREVGVDKPA